MNRLSGLIIGVSFFVTGVLFVILGCTFLPVLGIIVALPIMGASFHFLGLSVRAGETSKQAAYGGQYLGKPCRDAELA